MKIKLLIACILISLSVTAQPKKIRVAVNESKPYITFHRDHGKVVNCSGLTIDVLHYLFNENIEYVYCDSKQDVIDHVNNNTVDVGANITLTSDRMKGITYSLPYFETYVGVMTRKPVQPTLLESFITGIQNDKLLVSLLQVIAIITGLFFITGTILYFCEYRRDKKGYFLACYTSFVSIAFLAGLEGEPVRKSSKIILVTVTLFYSLTFAPYIIGYITAQIQEQHDMTSEYTTIDQLKHTTVYTAKNTSNESVLSESDIPHMTGDIDSVFHEMIDGNAVYVHDKNVLANFIFEHKMKDKLALTPIVIRKSSRVFFYSSRFKSHKEKYDMILEKMKNIGKTDQMASRYGIAP